jgi:hypothetical protein
MVHRQLDDMPIVSAKDSGLTKKFADAYVNLCEEIGVPLAEMCPDQEKAFGPGTSGTVLGVKFDSENLQWSWSHAGKNWGGRKNPQTGGICTKK